MNKKLVIYFAFLLLISGCSSKEYTAEKIIKSSGNQIQISDLKLEIQKIEIKDEVKPKNPQGYYNHFKKQDGYHYQVVTGTMTNQINKVINLNNIKVQGIAESNIYDGKLYAMSSIESDFIFKIFEKDERKFNIISIVENENKDTEIYNICYNKNFKIDKNQDKFDICIKHKINK